MATKQKPETAKTWFCDAEFQEMCSPYYPPDHNYFRVHDPDHLIAAIPAERHRCLTSIALEPAASHGVGIWFTMRKEPLPFILYEREVLISRILVYEHTTQAFAIREGVRYFAVTSFTLLESLAHFLWRTGAKDLLLTKPTEAHPAKK
ncbi:MAG: hypothetical protein HYY92_01930 [Parcubacteria group bacterium]|nr:hypothetical protein [Parcubacteria group bacterium]